MVDGQAGVVAAQVAADTTPTAEKVAIRARAKRKMVIFFIFPFSNIQLTVCNLVVPLKSSALRYEKRARRSLENTHWLLCLSKTIAVDDTYTLLKVTVKPFSSNWDKALSAHLTCSLFLVHAVLF